MQTTRKKKDEIAAKRPKTHRQYTYCSVSYTQKCNQFIFQEFIARIAHIFCLRYFALRTAHILICVFSINKLNKLLFILTGVVRVQCALCISYFKYIIFVFVRIADSSWTLINRKTPVALLIHFYKIERRVRVRATSVQREEHTCSHQTVWQVFELVIGDSSDVSFGFDAVSAFQREKRKRKTRANFRAAIKPQTASKLVCERQGENHFERRCVSCKSTWKQKCEFTLKMTFIYVTFYFLRCY